jgi:hypothetical protein
MLDCLGFGRAVLMLVVPWLNGDQPRLFFSWSQRPRGRSALDIGPL